MNYSMNKNR